MLNGRSSFSSVGNRPHQLNHTAFRKDSDSPMPMWDGQKIEKYVIIGKNESQSYKLLLFDLSGI